jgi:hypothetical protein
MLDNITADSAEIGGVGAGHLGITAINDMDPLADPGFPVEILPHLFLGNAQNSRDCDALDKHRIRVSSFQNLKKFLFFLNRVGF